MIGRPKSSGSVVLVSSFLAVAASVQAQDIATSFDQLRVLVKVGNTVTVTDATGKESKGKIPPASSVTLRLSPVLFDGRKGAVESLRF